MQLRQALGCFRGADIRGAFSWEVQEPSLAHRALGKTRLGLRPPRKAKSEFHFLKRPGRELHSAGHLQKTVFSVYFLLSSTQSPTAANARGQKCLEEEKQRQEVQAALRGAWPHRSPLGIWRWPPGEEKADARARLVRRKRLTRRFGQQNRQSPSEASSELAPKVGGEGLAQHLQDPPR
ncbi:hypothetical protein AAY473_011967 [Plecturocebus cupreus]